ncbi:two-component system copper resistance phosphate regulon response regulator CusR [Flavobacterium nitrogenifigens]|uniref:Two-component system copper resistance phosphate regulon response regulator CusR n=2 Tax=Flavobacterium TaxID=237 RepID=A0A7W7IXY2_9FLAO|nr:MULTISPECIES: response regulator transcription factor [Flavobacterium]MBB4802664.1 two-component system copper resistance phosphate regulon response regulator CusR [Flavobacterium nitrogenifigens]MBB6387622.1 two-component system copper resistance phosphate regulon response regulator CusR [Flavobacterium notoginsengisoli]
MNKVLLVEDDPRVASFIIRGLEEQLYQVKNINKGFDAINEVMENTYDIIILDIMLPDLTGFEVCEILRARKIIVPILILSALDTPHEKVKGLQAGADDYLAKPFMFEELLARINAQLRRSEFSNGIIDFQSYAGIEINMKEQSATRDGKELNLSSRELKLLIFFMKNREKALSRIAIAEAVWNLDLDMNTNTVDVYINYLRNKIDKNFPTPLIHTVKGTGYMLKNKINES